jgi:glycosyltransferase involved in cell wall biosynthesis
MERGLALVTDRVIAVSEAVRTDLVAVYRVCGRDRAGVIPLGLDLSWTDRLSQHRGALRRRYGIPDSARVVAIVGRLTAIKNHELFLTAARALGARDHRFVIVGDGERRGELERLTAAMGLRDRVIFTGWLEAPEAIYADLDVVCLTSLNEGTPVSLIEAMAAGRPFVATDVGGVVDLAIGEGKPGLEGFAVFDNGVLVPSGQPAVLAHALAFVLDRPELGAAMGRAGAALARQRFSKERLVHDVEALYMTVLGNVPKEAECVR